MNQEDVIRRLLNDGTSTLSRADLLALRREVDAELTRRHRLPPLVLDELRGEPLLELLHKRTGGSPPAVHLLMFMETWADEATLLDREPTATEIAAELGVSKPTVDRRMRAFRDALGTGQTPTALVQDLRSRWNGTLARVPVRPRSPEDDR